MVEREFVKLRHPESGEILIFDALEKNARLTQGFTLVSDEKPSETIEDSQDSEVSDEDIEF